LTAPRPKLKLNGTEALNLRSLLQNGTWNGIEWIEWLTGRLTDWLTACLNDWRANWHPVWANERTGRLSWQIDVLLQFPHSLSLPPLLLFILALLLFSVELELKTDFHLACCIILYPRTIANWKLSCLAHCYFHICVCLHIVFILNIKLFLSFQSTTFNSRSTCLATIESCVLFRIFILLSYP